MKKEKTKSKTAVCFYGNGVERKKKDFVFNSPEKRNPSIQKLTSRICHNLFLKMVD